MTMTGMLLSVCTLWKLLIKHWQKHRDHLGSPVVAAHLVIPDAGLFRVDDEATDLAHFLLTIPAAAVCSCTCFCVSFKCCLISLHDKILSCNMLFAATYSSTLVTGRGGGVVMRGAQPAAALDLVHQHSAHDSEAHHCAWQLASQLASVDIDFTDTL